MTTNGINASEIRIRNVKVEQQKDKKWVDIVTNDYKNNTIQ